MKQIYTLALAVFLTTPLLAQNTTEEAKKLNEVKIKSISKQHDIGRLDSIAGTYIFSGKKSEVIVSKKPDSSALAFQSINTAGSYGLVSTFNSISGTEGKFKYYAWFNKKANNGYRKNGDSKYGAQNISLFYAFNPNLELKAEWTRSNYVIHLSGQLTDEMFKNDPRSSTRSRNYYNPEINVPSITLDWKAGENTRLNWAKEIINPLMY